MDKKKYLRKKIQSTLSNLEKDQKNIWDKFICQKLENLIHNNNVRTVHTYLPMGNEVNIYPIIKKLLENKVLVVVPKTEKNRSLKHLILNSFEELEEGIFGTRHPIKSKEYNGSYDLILVPGLAFDRHLNRLGYGGGYYDRFLIKHKKTFKCSVCYPFQLVEEVPIESHDISVDKLIYPDNSFISS